MITPGTLLTIQQKGVLGVPWKALALCPAKYQDNNFHPSVGFCAGMLKDVSRYFQVGDKVYPVKVEVNVDKGKVSLTVVSCDSCNGINPPTSMKGEVNFQFAKGYLEKAGVGDVEDAIGKVFLIADENQQGQGNDSGQAPPPQQAGPTRQMLPAQQQSEPATVELGMTTDEVQSALGKPEKIFNVGAKQIYVYKEDVKVTFQNGKVADVQRGAFLLSFGPGVLRWDWCNRPILTPISVAVSGNTSQSDQTRAWWVRLHTPEMSVIPLKFHIPKTGQQPEKQGGTVSPEIFKG